MSRQITDGEWEQLNKRLDRIEGAILELDLRTGGLVRLGPRHDHPSDLAILKREIRSLRDRVKEAHNG